MVKTRSDVKGVRVSGKAPRKMPNASISSPSGRSSKKYNGHNNYCPREVPSWQKEITSFFAPNMNSPVASDQVPGSSGETSFAPSDE